MRRWLNRIHDYLFPHERNGYRPHFFSWRSIVGITAIVLFFCTAYFAVTTVVFHRTNFLSAVLPGALTVLTNQDRAANGVGQLVENPLLDQAAQEKAADMAAKGYFAHVAPDGKTPWYWLNRVGYDYTYAGENLAVNFTDSTDVENAWMHSPTHRANIVKGSYTEIGIGTAQGMYEGQETTFVVQFFGRPQPTAAAPAPAKPVIRLVKPAPTSTEAAASVPADQIATTSASPAEAVLGAESPGPSAPVAAAVAPASEPSITAAAVTVATSPNHVLAYAIGIICAIVFVLLIVAVFFHPNTKHLEVIAGAIIVLAIAVGALFFTVTRVSGLEIPQTATSSVSSY